MSEIFNNSARLRILFEHSQLGRKAEQVRFYKHLLYIILQVQMDGRIQAFQCQTIPLKCNFLPCFRLESVVQ